MINDPKVEAYDSLIEGEWNGLLDHLLFCASRPNWHRPLKEKWIVSNRSLAMAHWLSHGWSWGGEWRIVVEKILHEIVVPNHSYNFK